ncbi:MAG: histidine kinase dimerization/phospho-acceptor domain-containing protein [Opitutaceae bacterium]|nr:histidine kinase dimerization/phospho-acceptor domain-containing protein [Opitutaceae bacterium]
MANASHELRTPHSIIKGYVETLVDNHRSVPAEDRERFLKTIQRHSRHMNTGIEDLIQLSRLESAAPGVRVQTVHLLRLIPAVVEDSLQRPATEGYVINLKIAPEASNLSADPARLVQVFNILSAIVLEHIPWR